MLAEAEADRLVGVVLGGAYQLVGRIGEGGMGAVYEAHHLRLQKRVAVKLMNRALAHHPEALARFHREASIASRLGHPHLVNVIDFGTSEGSEPYLVMEYLEGENLDQRLRRAGTVPLKVAAQITRQVASALAVVHAKGVVHRDLKPANVFLVHVPGEPDFVKVLDFGVSKIKTAPTKLTDASTVIGTPEYMSPEQAAGSGDDIDHRADQWALACIVWEMLAGSSPFAVGNTDAVFYQLTNLSPPPLSKQVPDLPSAVEPVLLRALSKSAADRYPSTREFALAFEAAALGSWGDVTPMPFSSAKIAADVSVGRSSARRPGLRFRAALAGLAVAIVIAAAGLLFADARGRSPVTKPIAQASMVSLPVVHQIGPATQSMQSETVLRREDALAKRSFSSKRGTNKLARGARATRYQVARPVGRQPLFQDL